MATTPTTSSQSSLKLDQARLVDLDVTGIDSDVLKARLDGERQAAEIDAQNSAASGQQTSRMSDDIRGSYEALRAMLEGRTNAEQQARNRMADFIMLHDLTLKDAIDLRNQIRGEIEQIEADITKNEMEIADLREENILIERELKSFEDIGKFELDANGKFVNEKIETALEEWEKEHGKIDRNDPDAVKKALQGIHGKNKGRISELEGINADHEKRLVILRGAEGDLTKIIDHDLPNARSTDDVKKFQSRVEEIREETGLVEAGDIQLSQTEISAEEKEMEDLFGIELSTDGLDMNADFLKAASGEAPQNAELTERPELNRDNPKNDPSVQNNGMQV